MTPLRDWFSQGPTVGSWLPRSREAWALTVAIVVIGALVGRIN